MFGHLFVINMIVIQALIYTMILKVSDIFSKAKKICRRFIFVEMASVVFPSLDFNNAIHCKVNIEPIAVPLRQWQAYVF